MIGLFLLPDYPLTTRWLTPEERQLAHDRIVRDTVGLESSKGARAGFAQAIRDPRLYLLCLMQNMHLSACSFNNFFVSIYQYCQRSKNRSDLRLSPPWSAAWASAAPSRWC